MPVQWTSADGRTITINAKYDSFLPSSADIIEICGSKTLDKEVGDELVALSNAMTSNAKSGLAAIAAQYKDSPNVERNRERLQYWATGLVRAHTLLEHFKRRPRLLAEEKDLADALGPTTVTQALNDMHTARKAFCGLDRFCYLTKMSVEDVAALFRLPPVDTQPTQETQGGSKPTASEAASPASSHASSPLQPGIQTPPFPQRLWTSHESATRQRQQGPQAPQQDDGANGSTATCPPAQIPRKRVAFSADDASASTRFRSSYQDDGSPKPDDRYPKSFYEGRQPLMSDAQFRQAVTEVYRDFFDNYTAHIHANVAGPDAREMALCVLKDGLCNSLWRLLNFRGDGFTSVLGVISEKRR